MSCPTSKIKAGAKGSFLWIDGIQRASRVGLLKSDGQWFIIEKTVTADGQDILPRIDRLLEEHHLALKDLEAIACTLGPGSFTGLRVVHAITKALAWAQAVPVIALGTMDILKHHYVASTKGERPDGSAESELCCLLPSRKGRMYLAVYVWDSVKNQWSGESRGEKTYEEIAQSHPRAHMIGIDLPPVEVLRAPNARFDPRFLSLETLPTDTLGDMIRNACEARTFVAPHHLQALYFVEQVAKVPPKA